MVNEARTWILPWEAHLPGPPGTSKAEDVDPFQVVEELTTRDIQWQSIMKVASWGLEDVHQFLRILMERLNSGTSSMGDPSVSTKARVSQTNLQGV